MTGKRQRFWTDPNPSIMTNYAICVDDVIYVVAEVDKKVTP